MAVIKSKQATKVVLSVETGVKADGSTVYSARSITNMNPALSDEDLYGIGSGFGALQSCPVGAIVRHDTAVLSRA